MLHHREEKAVGEELPKTKVVKCYACKGDGRVLSQTSIEIRICTPCSGMGEIILHPEDQVAYV